MSWLVSFCCIFAVCTGILWPSHPGFLHDPLEHFDCEEAYRLQYPLEAESVMPMSGKETVFEKGEIPEYVIRYAPVVHLYSEEKYLPYDVNEYVPKFYLKYGNGSNVTTEQDLPLNLSHLAAFAPRGDDNEPVFMTSLDDFSTDPDWITGQENKINYETGEIKNASATLIVVDKGNGWVDSYWFYFYAFNLGPFVMGKGPYGNHVGDWEHSLVRFYKGKPVILWMSAHSGGNGYKFNAVEKYDRESKVSRSFERPVIFSARGTHANYASVGQHSHDLPYSILCDFTDRGPLWDPSLNYLAYTWDGKNLTPALNDTAGPSREHKYRSREQKYGPWLLFWGRWGDKKLDPHDPRQRWSPWEYKYIDGPMGPLNKNLLRSEVCQGMKWWKFWGGCTIRRYLDMGTGLDSEGVSSCIVLANQIENQTLRRLFVWIAHGGLLCTVADAFWA